MAKRFSQRILEYIRRPDYVPQGEERLAMHLGIADQEMGDFHDAVDALRRVGRVVIGTDNSISLPRTATEVIGTYRGNPRGFGFVVPDEETAHGDLYIPEDAGGGAITGDRVLVRVVRRGQRDGKAAFGGQVVKILERGQSRFVGEVCRDGGMWYVRPNGNVLHVPIAIGDAGAKSAKVGEQVVVELVEYPKPGRPARGVIVERLGKSGQPGVDLLGIVRQYNLPDEFPPEVLAEARAAVAGYDPESAAEGREELSEMTIITIDPDDAKDYDDAISLVPLGANTAETSGGKRRAGRRAVAGEAAWELGVHIADVSSFVPVGGALDAEAAERGTSVYFPGHVIPMLPEVLSNGVCSLQEGEPRLCKSAFIRYDAEGRVVGARFANTVIRSAKRLTYTQAQAMIDGETGGARKPVIELLRNMNRLARTIRERRLADGMIVLELPEIQLKFDDKEQVIDAGPTDTSFTHTIIEMFMVEANEAVARRLKSLQLPFLRRIHPDPDEDSMESVVRFLRAIGHPVPKHFTHADLQGMLGKVKGKPESYMVNLAVLKSMQLAEYSPKDIGHFALASKSYAHFTSPIRRYPDLLVHRLLQHDFEGSLRGRRKGGRGSDEAAYPSEDELKEWGRKLSYTSRRAEAAEREYRTLKILQLLHKHLGDVFEGVVTSVTNFGLFVQHPKYLIEGLLRIEDLGDDWWEVDLQGGRVVGERSRRSFSIGRTLPVQIADVDLAARQLKLSLAPGHERRGKADQYVSPMAAESHRKRGRQKPGRAKHGPGRPQSSRRGRGRGHR